MPKTLKLEVIVGSKTAKLVVLDGNRILFEKYSRHMIEVEKTVRNFFDEASTFPKK